MKIEIKLRHIVYSFAPLCVAFIIFTLLLLAGKVYPYGSIEFGNWAMWSSAIATFFAALGTILTFIFLIIQNNQVSSRQDETERLNKVSKLNDEVNQYNSLVFIIYQHNVDKSNELHTSHKLFDNSSMKFNASIFNVWKTEFKKTRHVTNSINFQEFIQKKFNSLAAEEIYELFYYFILSKKENTARLNFSIERAVHAQKIIHTHDFIKENDGYDKKVVSECIGHLCRELHSHQYRMTINKHIDALYSTENEFLKIYNNFTKDSKSEFKDEMLSLVRNNLVITIVSYLTYIEILSKEVALFEDSIEYIQKNYGKKLKTQCNATKGANEVVMYNTHKLELLNKLSSREVILFELR